MALDLDGYAAGQRMLDDIARAKMQKPEVADEIARLAELDLVSYDRQREEVAKTLKVRVSTLDQEVRRVREAAQEKDKKLSITKDAEPWAQPVSGALLLDELRTVCQRFVILPRDGDSVLALWLLFTHTVEVAECAPILALLSPEKRCGKTTVITLVGKLARRPLAASNITPAAIFRCVEEFTPTLLIDEADSFLGANDETRGILNSGHTRATAYVIRTVGDDHTVKQFSTWGAKLIAMIGRLPDTLHDRSIVLHMRRKLPSETCEKLKHADPYDFEVLQRKCRRWTQDNLHRLRGAKPRFPDELDDRGADNWEPLLSIADVAGGRWPELAREVAVAFSGGEAEATDSVRVELLRNIATIFAGLREDRISSKELVELLAVEPEWRWATFGRGHPITQRQLAGQLRHFGITSGTHRMKGDVSAKGYLVKQFADTFKRYIPFSPGKPPSDPLQRNNCLEPTAYPEKSSVTEGACYGSKSGDNGLIEKSCYDVTDENPLPGGEEDFSEKQCLKCDGEGCAWCR